MLAWYPLSCEPLPYLQRFQQSFVKHLRQMDQLPWAVQVRFEIGIRALALFGVTFWTVSHPMLEQEMRIIRNPDLFLPIVVAQGSLGMVTKSSCMQSSHRQRPKSISKTEVHGQWHSVPSAGRAPALAGLSLMPGGHRERERE